MKTKTTIKTKTNNMKTKKNKVKTKSNSEGILILLKAGKKVTQKSTKFTNVHSLSAQISKFRKIGMNIICENGAYRLVIKRKK